MLRSDDCDPDVYVRQQSAIFVVDDDRCFAHISRAAKFYRRRHRVQRTSPDAAWHSIPGEFDGLP